MSHTHIHAGVFDADALWRCATLGEGAISVRRGVFAETLTTIFVERDNPEAGTVYENPDGTWHIDFPPGPIRAEVLVDVAHAILDVLDEPR